MERYTSVFTVLSLLLRERLLCEPTGLCERRCGLKDGGKKSEAPAKTQTLGDAKASDGQKNVAKCMEYIKANTSVPVVISGFLSDK